MPDGRLALLDPDIQRELSGASPSRLRRIAIEAAAMAIESIAEHPIFLDEAMTDLRRGVIDPTQANLVSTLAAELDDRYLALHDVSPSRAATNEWQEAFRLARAASALAYAFSPQPGTAASESVYEALASLDEDVEGVLALVRSTSQFW